MLVDVLLSCQNFVVLDEITSLPPHQSPLMLLAPLNVVFAVGEFLEARIVQLQPVGRFPDTVHTVYPSGGMDYGDTTGVDT